MAKETGLAWSAMSVDDAGGTLRDIRNDITNFQFATPRAVQDVTGIDRSAMERLLLLADMSTTCSTRRQMPPTTCSRPCRPARLLVNSR
jgi:hypothetical protein